MYLQSETKVLATLMQFNELFARVLLLKFERGTTFLLKMHFSSPFPPNTYNVEHRKRLKVVVFNIVLGGGGEVRQVKLHSCLVLPKAPKVQLFPKTMIHDWR